nr:MFS transporter [Brooklawnia cerclae]
MVSLLSDVVADGSKSIVGPFLQSLGATAFVTGLVGGLAEATSLVLRLVFGPVADRKGSYWRLTMVGYAMTAVFVPLLALTPFLGSVGLVVASSLVVAERLGKAIRSPSKSVLLARVTGIVGHGKGFGVHKALDEMGALLGPLIVAGVIALTGHMWAALAVLIVPGLISLAVLAWLRVHAVGSVETVASSGPDPSAVREDKPDEVGRGWWVAGLGDGLGGGFLWFAASSALTTAGLVSFTVISYHMADAALVPLWAVPLVFAAGQATAAVAAVAAGAAYDRVGARVLYAVPVLVAVVPVLAFGESLGAVVAGVIVWGAAGGLQDSTVKALIADLVAPERRATAFGVFAAVQGSAAVLGGVLSGALYQNALPILVVIIGVFQVAAGLLLAATLRRRAAGQPSS